MGTQHRKAGCVCLCLCSEACLLISSIARLQDRTFMIQLKSACFLFALGTGAKVILSIHGLSAETIITLCLIVSLKNSSREWQEWHMPCPSFVSLLMNLSTQKLNRHSRAGSKASLSHQYQEPVASQRANFPLKCLTQNTMLFYKACTWSSWSSSSVQCGIQACSIITEAVKLHELCPTLTQVLLEPHRWPSSNPPYLLPALS